jgi:hypothetical protein
MRSGRIRATVVFPQQHSTGRVVFGHNAATGAYFSAGIGGYGFAYVLDEYVPGLGWHGRRTEGTTDNLTTETPYNVEVHLRGQRVRLFVNSVRVLEGSFPQPLTDDQVGLFAFGDAPVEFSKFAVEIDEPQTFVVTQYGEPYETLFQDVIGRAAKEMGFFPYRAKDVSRPGLILENIVQGLVESEVIIAEITPANRNVFYELGYAHALKKPTILLAKRGSKLPFDVQGYRCIFYVDSVDGKNELVADLKRHLASIKGIWHAPR